MTDNFGELGHGPGPLGDIQNQVSSVLNGNGNPNTVYIPGEPVFPVPNVRTLLAAVSRFVSHRGN